MAPEISRRHRRMGFTLAEALIATAISSLVVGGVWMMFGTLMGDKDSKASVVNLTAESFLRQEALHGLRALTRRLQESIQIVTPVPGESSPTMTFRDMLNDEVRLEVQGGALVAIGEDGEERSPKSLTANGKTFKPVQPTRIPGCDAAVFTTLSPTCVIVQLTFEDERGKQSTILNTVQLQNGGLAR